MRLLLPEPRPLEAQELLDLYDPGSDPSLRGGFVLSTDGGIAQDGSSRALQSPADEAVFHALRAVADAVVVGAGTVRIEGYGAVRPRPDGQAWRAQRALPAQPPLVLISRSLDLDPSARCFDGPAILVTCAAAPGRDRFPDVVIAGQEQVDLPDAVRQLALRGFTRLLCEGGPQLLTALLQAGLVDELCLTHTPRLLGAAPGLLTEPTNLDLELRHLVDGGGGVLLGRYGVHR
jgi:riboflavin biosynthesis pyrimidine reductase